VLGEAGITPNVILEAEAMSSTLKLGEQGVGHTILSCSSVHRRVGAGRVKLWPIVEPRLARQLILATSSQRPITAATRDLADMVRSQVREPLRQGLWFPREHAERPQEAVRASRSREPAAVANAGRRASAKRARRTVNST
jgi:LysR family nitrogen assimilation transcriptional regulator